MSRQIPRPTGKPATFTSRRPPPAAQNALIRDPETELNRIVTFKKCLLKIKERRSIFPRSSSVKPTILFSK
ncbi:hypothetical protein L6164_037848 [Bauhinia variegata]|uniref:Uncharacterized protein n=1 Tax=Bauhinia variegata TaxID=167791 RepID=A0ACB9KLM5_BAUVA|nr:hypothetical protein L6164_037848 [Bauhinia variegata]